jgi:elongator complex protein 3
MLRLGATRVEVGVQTTDEKLLNLTKRGHGTYENKKAFRKLREAGFKITAHWMPGLTGMYGKVDIKKEVENFEELFKNPDYRPDELKIYPTLVIQGTELYDMWKLGKYDPLTFDQTIELMIEMKKHVPKYVRIKRIMRDISEHEAEAGARTTNLRQLLHEKMNDKKIYCNCIRCREVGHKSGKPGEIELKTEEYKAGGGMEFFISFESENNMLIGFVRLRIDDSDSAKVRELHVYGKMIPLDEKSDAYQHTGYGKKLLQKAEEVAKSFSKPFVQVTSGVGVRDYYRKLGYVLKGPYMVKTL